MTATVHITRGPNHEYSREPDSQPTRWCFGCRQHLPHEIVVLGDPPEVRSYYAPIALRRCTRCRRDRTAFPGCDFA